MVLIEIIAHSLRSTFSTRSTSARASRVTPKPRILLTTAPGRLRLSFPSQFLRLCMVRSRQSVLHGVPIFSVVEALPIRNTLHGASSRRPLQIITYLSFSACSSSLHHSLTSPSQTLSPPLLL